MSTSDSQQDQQNENRTAHKRTSKRKRVLVVAIIAVIVVIIGVVAATQFLGSSSSSDSATDAETAAAEAAEEETRDAIRAVYDPDAQAEIRAELDDAIAEGSYTEDNPYVVENPFGTNTLSWYVYFTTDDPMTVSYTVEGDEDAGIADFTRTPYGGDELATEHEFQLIGLIPDSVNTVTLTLTAEDGSTRQVVIEQEVSALMGTEKTQLDVEEGASTEELADGLYAILGNDSDHLDFLYYYDNTGQIRSEIPIIGYRAHRLLFDDDCMYYSISTNKIAKVDHLGQVRAVYNLGDFELHHDYVFDDNGSMLVLATDTTADDASVEDRVVRVDLETEEVTEVLDLADLFGDLKETAEVGDDGDLDWMHINTIQWLGDDSVLLSSRETSTIIKVSDLYGTPTVDYLIGDEAFWGDTEYADLLLDQAEPFASNGGQHSVTYVPDDSLEDGQYYLYLFDNNLGVSESYPDMDWSELGGTIATSMSEGTTSYYRKFLVDENAGTVELVDEFEVPFSGYVSSVEDMGDTIVVDSGIAGTFGEYDADGTLIRRFTMEVETMIYRVYKYDFSGYYFAD